MAFYSVPYFILLAVGVQANYFEVLILNVMITMIISIVPIPGGTGGAELSFKSLFAMFLTNQSSMVLAMFLWRFVTYFLGMILGLIASWPSHERVNFY
ncbi:flippase-like domain-containing protein [Amylolactobacillus amylophilus]|uniref:flippase-like domain-containing protein n=1 Tax=Amylolactobacillus amylophilus TaxID=1603 RepID=UPI0034E1ABCF